MDNRALPSGCQLGIDGWWFVYEENSDQSASVDRDAEMGMVSEVFPASGTLSVELPEVTRQSKQVQYDFYELQVQAV